MIDLAPVERVEELALEGLLWHAVAGDVIPPLSPEMFTSWRRDVVAAIVELVHDDQVIDPPVVAEWMLNHGVEPHPWRWFGLWRPPIEVGRTSELARVAVHHLVRLHRVREAGHPVAIAYDELTRNGDTQRAAVRLREALRMIEEAA